ncbi:MAG: hypothetical protein HYX64_11485 [Gammaproteobacteria bacterium]|nr:hypothetical protein [Gammaproteobacteria bacterium]
MKPRRLVWVAMGSLMLSGATLAQDGKGMGMGMGMMGDGDAKITKEEFLKRSEARFARMDVNKDGVIDASDREKMRAQMQTCMEMMGGMGMMGGGMGMMGGGMGMMGGGMMGGGTKE